MKSLQKIFFLVFFAISAEAQSTLPDEKVYLSIENSHFLPGDSLRFKAFISANHLPKSSILYVELIAPDLSLIQEQTIHIDGLAMGAIGIPASVDSGTYFVRAYTHYLSGFGSEAFFQKAIVVGHEIAKTPTINIGIEGGRLVEGLPSKIVIHAAKQQLSVVNEQNDLIANLSTNASGIAEAVLVPLFSQKYYVLANNSKYLIGDVQASGSTMAISQKDTTTTLRIFNKQAKTDSITLVVRQLGGTIFSLKTKKNTINLSNFNASILPKGLLEFSVLDDSLHTLTSRLWLNLPEGNRSEQDRYLAMDYYVSSPIEATILPEKAWNNYLILSKAKQFKQHSVLEKESKLSRSGIAFNTENVLLKNTNLLVFANAKSVGIQKIKTDTSDCENSTKCCRCCTNH